MKEKFDSDYAKEYEACIAGVCIFLLLAFIREKGIDPNYYISGLICACSGIYAYKIADRQNRDKWRLGALGMVIPGVVLVVLGLSNKVKFKLVVDKNDTPDKQYAKCKEIGDTFIGKRRYKDALIVYEFLVNNFQNHQDNDVYTALKQKTKP